MSMEIILVQTVVNGLMVGMIYVLMAIGFTMVFGIMRVVNFAHGEFYMIGAFLFAILYGSHDGMPFVISVLLADWRYSPAWTVDGTGSYSAGFVATNSTE